MRKESLTDEDIDDLKAMVRAMRAIRASEAQEEEYVVEEKVQFEEPAVADATGEPYETPEREGQPLSAHEALLRIHSRQEGSLQVHVEQLRTGEQGRATVEHGGEGERGVHVGPCCKEKGQEKNSTLLGVPGWIVAAPADPYPSPEANKIEITELNLRRVMKALKSDQHQLAQVTLHAMLEIHGKLADADYERKWPDGER